MPYRQHKDANIQVALIPDMIHLEKVDGFTITCNVTRNLKVANETQSQFLERYSPGLYKEEVNRLNSEVKKLERNHNNPMLFFFLEKRTYHLVKNNKELQSRARYNVFVFRRDKFIKNLISKDRYINELSKRIEEYKDKYQEASLFEKIKMYFSKEGINLQGNYDYEIKRKDNEINDYLNKYFDFLEVNFSRLKISSNLLKNLKDQTLISLRFDVSKTLILLDSLIEKIYHFFYVSKEIEGDGILDKLINDSIIEFETYINKIIDKMKKYNENAFIDDFTKDISKEEKDKIDKVKTLIFNNEE